MSIVLDPVNGITQASWTTAGRPASPSAGQVGFNTSLNALEQYTGSSWETIPTWTTSNRPVTPAAGYSGYNTDTKAFEFYNGTTWIGFNQTSLSTTASYLLVAGGGGGGTLGGGGGAGGLKTGTVTLNQNTTYFITVGGGGSQAAGSYPVNSVANGSTGADSSISGAGLTTITSTGGGYGGYDAGGAGGSGGGAGGWDSPFAFSGGAGTPGQGNNGGATSGNPSSSGSGGGGSGSVGGAFTGANTGTGGSGTASSITGTSITYAGGGGGGVSSSVQTSAQVGGSGGGGAGGYYSAPTYYNGVSGLANTGSGGGGGGRNAGVSNTGTGAGGSGVAIISYPGSQVFTGGTVTTSGGNTIHTFTTSAALLPTTNGSTFNNSLRFRASASAYLSRTPSVAGSQTTWTLSAWVKRGAFDASNNVPIFYARTSGATAVSDIGFDTNNCFRFFDRNSASTTQANLISTQVFRDVSAWYHIVVAVDTTQATSSNRIKLYVNGVQVSAFGTATYPSQNTTLNVNSTASHFIASSGPTYGVYTDGYMSNVQFIDGQQLSAAYFGTNNSNGVWVPVPYTGTYGTNGFFLNFGDGPFLTTSSNTGIGKDSSGNGNYWVTNNISVTTGSTFDLMTDVPTLTSATAANYCVLNPLSSTTAPPTFSNGNLQAATPSTGGGMSYGTFALPTSGKYYWEVYFSSFSAGAYVGVSQYLASYSFLDNSTNAVSYNYGGQKFINGTGTAYGASYTVSDIIGVAVDVDSGTITFYKNNVSQGAISFACGGLFPAISDSNNSASSTYIANFGQRPFAYTPPSGYVALNTYNLSTPTILQGNLYMDATTYTGNGGTQTIVNQAGFKPDFVWVKSRSNTNWHNLMDSVRGTNKDLFSNSTAAEETNAQIYTAINSNGFSVGTDNSANQSGQTFVGWQWQAGQGSTSSNTSGSITSTTSVSTTAGFSVVTYTGNSTTNTNYTVGHSLGVAPKMVIIKSITWAAASSAWAVWHTSSPSALVYLDSTDAASSGDYGYFMGSTAPTSTVFTVRCDTTPSTGARFRTFGAYNYVAYCWAEIAGFSKFGSYTGNGSTDGPFVYLGFRPKFIMIKRTDATTSWFIHDTARDTYNVANLNLYPNLTAAEELQTTWNQDIVSNGFKTRGTSTEINASGGTYIYAAFAENPFKYANAR